MQNRDSKNKYSRTFSEIVFPARTSKVAHKASKLAKKQLKFVAKMGKPSANNVIYVKWLKRRSMLKKSQEQALHYAGKGQQWQNAFAKPRPRSALRKSSVWYTAYPMSLITKDKQSSIAALGDDELWSLFEKIGITGMHTGPMKRAGGLDGWKYTPSIDGHFDRIANDIDPIFGTEEEYAKLCQTAKEHSALIIDDIVPGHTGKGYDFRLAEMNYKEYKGIYHMVEIEPSDWHMLPNVEDGKDSANLSHEQELTLKKSGYIIGRLQRVIFYEPGVKETNWSATKQVKGVDGVTRRWVYLHYFKEGQPSINWLDPTFAGMKLVVGDALHSIGSLGSSGLRLDANGFLGIEKGDEDSPAWSEGHPLSEAANHLIAGMVRKIGGFTFQELNLSVDDIKAMSIDGADLSYDFINRPAYHHALATQDAEFLKLTLGLCHQYEIDPASLVHAMQNHDELTYELVHFWTKHKDDLYKFRDQEITGANLRLQIRSDLKNAVVGEHAPYNMLFTENGIACTTTSFIAACLGYENPEVATSEQIEKIMQAHLLLVMFNALQPGVFALSGWDLAGCLTLPSARVSKLINNGDTRWINRGAYDLLGTKPNATMSESGLPVAGSLYGDLPSQLNNERSFASSLSKILKIREHYKIAMAKQIAIPETSAKEVLAMLHQLDSGELQLTVLNFSQHPVNTVIISEFFTDNSVVKDMLETQSAPATIQNLSQLSIELSGLEGRSLLIK